MTAGAFLAGVGSAGSGLFNAGLNFLNYQEQKNVNRWNQENQLQAWARDDTARQRMVQDLESAGLSKWLATGASPMTSSPIQLSAPKMDNINLDAAQHMYDNYITEKQTDAQTKLQASQAAAADASKEVAEAEKKIKAQELRVKTHDADVLTNRDDVASTDPMWMKYISEGLNTLRGSNTTGRGIVGAYQELQKAMDERKEQKREEKRIAHEKKEEKKDEEFRENHPYERRKPMSQSQWMTQHNIPRTGENAQIYAKEYFRYVDSYYRDSRARR